MGHPHASRKEEIPSLNGWRAVALILVVLTHANLVPGGFGILAVMIFFFLSGYLITTLMMEDAIEKGSIHLGKFYLRRFLRLMPPLFVTLSIAYPLVGLGIVSGRTGLAGFLSLLFSYHNYFYLFLDHADSVPLGLGICWTLAVEEHFYLVLPILLAVMLRRRAMGRTKYLMAALCVVVLVWRIVLSTVLYADFDRIYYATDTRIDSILFGCLLALWKPPVKTEHPERWGTLHHVLISVSAAALAASFLLRNEEFRKTFQFSVVGLALMPLFHFSIRFPDSSVFRLLNHRVLSRIGSMSYTIYLVHCLVLFNIGKWVPGRLWGLLLSLVLIGAYALLMERYVELPFRTMRRRLHR